jgi:hypothetical protein
MFRPRTLAFTGLRSPQAKPVLRFTPSSLRLGFALTHRLEFRHQEPETRSACAPWGRCGQ